VIILHTAILFGVLVVVSSYLSFQKTETLGENIEVDMPEVKLMRQSLS